MLYLRSIDEHVEEMKNAAEAMVAKSYPLVSRHDDKAIQPLKQRKLIVDGYDIFVTFSRHDYGKYIVENLEIIGVYCPFLPMHLVCKVATKFLGGHRLLHYNRYVAGHKAYFWKIYLDSTGKPLNVKPKHTEDISYEGLRFSFILK